MKVFVTGSTGLVGNNLVRALEAKGFDVGGLVRSEEKGKRLLGDTNATLVKGDMLDVPSFADALDGCEAVFHTAAYFREYFQPGDHAQALEDVNITGTLNLMTEADKRGVRRFVHVSSGGTIGMKPDGSPGDEDTPPPASQLENLYFKSKVDGDAKIHAWQAANAMQVVEILPGWIWGPGDAAPTAAGQLALDFMAKKLPGIIDGGTCIVDARDVAESMIAAVEKGRHGEKYIVGGRYYSLEQLSKGLEQVSGVPSPTMHVPHGILMVYAWFQETMGSLTGKDVLVTREGVRLMHANMQITSAKAERELGATFRPIEETLRDVVVWYREHPMGAG